MRHFVYYTLVALCVWNGLQGNDAECQRLFIAVSVCLYVRLSLEELKC